MIRRALYFTAGIAAGVAVGAAVSLLLTPASGEDLRKGTRQRFRHILDESARAAAERRAELEAELATMTGTPEVKNGDTAQSNGDNSKL
ncbi:MAG: hypothetical protein GYB66_06650 [Chloroflexi bacterium]|nr:hypothetical protein [Chloroflexota bacterium]